MLKWNEWEIANEDARLLKNQQDPRRSHHPTGA